MSARLYAEGEIEGYLMDPGTIEEEVLCGEPEDFAIKTAPLFEIWQRLDFRTRVAMSYALRQT